MIALSIGKATYDITVPVEDYPIENTKSVLKEKLEGSGGGASNVAYLLGKWACDTYFAGTVGYDDLGNSIKKELESVRVKTRFVEVNYERKTTTCFIIANKKTTSRTQLLIEPEVYHLKKYEYDMHPDVIYSDGFEYLATMAAINKFPNAVTVLGAGINYSDEKELLALAKYAKYVIFSLEFACYLTKLTVDFNQPATLLNLYKNLKEKFPNSINIVTLKSMGALYANGDDVKIMKTVDVKEVDRTGAGDIFDGAFTYAIAKGYDIEKSIRIANIAAGLSTTKYGAKNSVPILSDVIRYYENKFGNLEEPHFEEPVVDKVLVPEEAEDNSVKNPLDNSNLVENVEQKEEVVVAVPEFFDVQTLKEPEPIPEEVPSFHKELPKMNVNVMPTDTVPLFTPNSEEK